MLRGTTLASLLGATLLLLPQPGALMAQEEEEQAPGYAYVMTVDVDIADRQAYEEALTGLVKAAGEAGIPAENSWYFWSHASGYTLVYPFKNMAYWDDPGQFWRKFDGTPGEAGLDAFRAAMREIHTEAASEITVSDPAWGYWPEGYTEVKVAHVHNDWLNPGSDAAYDELAKEYIAFLGEIGYPYAVQGHRTLIGGDKMTWVTFADNLAGYFSEANWEDLIAAADAQEKWDGLIGKWASLVSRYEHMSASYEEEMSFTPTKE